MRTCLTLTVICLLGGLVCAAELPERVLYELKVSEGIRVKVTETICSKALVAFLGPSSSRVSILQITSENDAGTKAVLASMLRGLSEEKQLGDAQNMFDRTTVFGCAAKDDEVIVVLAIATRLAAWRICMRDGLSEGRITWLDRWRVDARATHPTPESVQVTIERSAGAWDVSVRDTRPAKPKDPVHYRID